MTFRQPQSNGADGEKVLVRECETCLTVQYPEVLTTSRLGFTIWIESGVATVDPEWTPEHRSRLLSRSYQGPMMERYWELYRERQWEIYRRSVVEGMPDSDYKTAVLAGIAHKLMRLDSIEASQSPLIEGAAASRTDQKRGLARTASARGGWSGSG